MLPFLKKQEGSASQSVETVKRSNLDERTDSLEIAVREIFSAKSDKERAEAFRAAFQILEQEPHKEINHG